MKHQIMQLTENENYLLGKKCLRLLNNAHVTQPYRRRSFRTRSSFLPRTNTGVVRLQASAQTGEVKRKPV